MKRAHIRQTAVFALLIALFLAMLTLNLHIGSLRIAPSEVWQILFGAEDAGIATTNVIWKIRLPRLLAAAILGGALSVSGFLLQTFFRNPIAGPYVLGISSGAKLFVSLAMVQSLRIWQSVPFSVMMLSSFVGAMLCTGLVLLFSQKVRSMSVLIVIGIMVGNICSAATDFFITFAQDSDIANLHSWNMGSFSAISWDNLGTACMVIFPALAVVVLLSKPIGAFQLGEQYAQSMGVNVKRFRGVLIFLSSVLSACVTALTGPISFVGVAVPHMAKLLFGTAKPLVMIPGTFLLGGVFCMLCDLIARTAFAPTELAISTVTAVFGAPVVIYLMLGREKGRDHG